MAKATASPGLAAYDSAGIIVDTNVWIDCIDKHSAWHDWAIDQLQACNERAGYASYFPRLAVIAP